MAIEYPHPESKWTHAICSDCYKTEEPDRPDPVRLTLGQLMDATPEVCCFCGVVTDEGIYYRKDPAVVHG